MYICIYAANRPAGLDARTLDIQGRPSAEALLSGGAGGADGLLQKRSLLGPGAEGPGDYTKPRQTIQTSKKSKQRHKLLDKAPKCSKHIAKI